MYRRVDDTLGQLQRLGENKSMRPSESEEGV
uniref:Uncharacterized protein n=1 Tax=Anguilla anguilla TaxID=7936 RepID=A0A0E9R056_ANGAN